MPRVESRLPSQPAYPSQQYQGQLNPLPKKKHVCPTCDRAFTTSGHLARHSRVHTGERNHKCPFPGCETRCSRQDNLQQHYRIHLAPGSRRTSRTSVTRVGRRAPATAAPSEPPLSPPPLSSPPALEPARVYAQHSPPPDSPPPLAQATLPATVQIPDEGSSRSSSSPEMTYSPLNSYSYRTGTSTYQEQSQGSTYTTYVHTTPISQSSSTTSLSSLSSLSSYSSQSSFASGSLPQISTSSALSHQSSPSPVSSVSLTSRHSIAHISPQTSYESIPINGPPSPASSASVSSQQSGPTTPSYSGYPDSDDAHAYHAHGLQSPSELSQAGYSPSIAVTGKYDPPPSPPPILAPIHGTRGLRRDSLQPSYIHHPQPLVTAGDYRYGSSLAMDHPSWKSSETSPIRAKTLVQ